MNSNLQCCTSKLISRGDLTSSDRNGNDRRSRGRRHGNSDFLCLSFNHMRLRSARAFTVCCACPTSRDVHLDAFLEEAREISVRIVHVCQGQGGFPPIAFFGTQPWRQNIATTTSVASGGGNPGEPVRFSGSDALTL